MFISEGVASAPTVSLFLKNETKVFLTFIPFFFCYCIIFKRYSSGENLISFFFFIALSLEGSKQVSTFEAIQLMIAFATLVLLIIDRNDQKKITI
ncbi:hypothetical protein AOY33_10065 [Enterococcus durans]|nr:hypothetical protein AOY33_10065 [Enterococcus durans]